MIRSFNDSETEKIFDGTFSWKLPKDIQRSAARKLKIINASTNINDLRVPPSNHLKKLKGSKAGVYGIRINDQWRICFTWSSGHAYNLEIVDYH